MNQSSLPSDDLPPVRATQLDGMLRRQLEQSTGKCFYEACDCITQALLSSCDWYIITNADGLTLVIPCPDVVTYWNIVSEIAQIASRLEQFASSATIRVYPPMGKGIPFEIGVDGISTYRDSF